MAQNSGNGMRRATVKALEFDWHASCVAPWARISPTCPTGRPAGRKVGRRHRPFQDRPGHEEGGASHPMPLVTCNDAPQSPAGQETFDSARRLAAMPQAVGAHRPCALATNAVQLPWVKQRPTCSKRWKRRCTAPTLRHCHRA